MKSQTQSLNVFEISTTSYNEENFHLLTTLTEDQIIKVIKPIVQAERDAEGDEDKLINTFYDNETLVNALQEAYPKDIAEYYQSFETIKI